MSQSYKKLERTFARIHNNPPPPFNPKYDPNAVARSRMVSKSLEDDNYYSTHTREECKTEWAKRYAIRKELDKSS